MTIKTKSSASDYQFYTGVMNVRLSFGEWLDDQIRRKGWSQAAFSDAVGVARQTVNSWVNGVQPPRRRALRDVAKILDLDINEVLVRAGYPPLDPDYRLPEEREPEPEARGTTGRLAERERFFAKYSPDISTPTPSPRVYGLH